VSATQRGKPLMLLRTFKLQSITVIAGTSARLPLPPSMLLATPLMFTM
jgi:hypothetical protein